MNAPWLILADDLTGACDAAGAFRSHGHQCLIALNPMAGLPANVVVAIDLDVREEPEGSARIANEVRAARTGAEGRQVYLKIDSTLRGPVRTLVGAAAQAGRTIVCPAFPAQGRRVCRGRVLAHGVPVERDGGDLKAIFSPLGLTEDGLFIPEDVETDQTLDSVARRSDADVWVGSAGLARALARANPRADPIPQRSSVDRVVIVAGSRHARTRDQVASLDAVVASIDLYSAPPEFSAGEDPGVAAGLVEMASGDAGGDPAGWIATGGATARALLTRFGVSKLEVGGEVEPGIPWMVALDGAIAGQPVVTKSGGFGDPGSLRRAAEFLLQGP